LIVAGEACSNAPYFAGAPKIAAAVQQVRSSIVPSGDLLIQSYSEVFPFGPTNMNFTLERYLSIQKDEHLKHTYLSVCFLFI
jgi:hypothetical protein